MASKSVQYRKDQVYREAFESVMATGAAEFAGLWLAAQASVTDKVRGMGIDITRPEIKAVMAVTVLHALYNARRYYEPPKESGN